MDNGLKFDYYYGAEAEQFSFYRVPRLLIKDERFKGLSSDAKLLYGLMLDRMSLSMKNGWFDDENRAYIHYTVENIMESVIEHEKVSVRIICDRGVTHEIVRHRIASYSQESTRYCNYCNEKFGKELTVIKPVFWEEGSEEYNIWLESMQKMENAYNLLIEKGVKPQEARSILPNSLKTEIIVTMNLREWRHFFKLRTSVKAHPQMREVACAILDEFKNRIPVVFDDIE